MLHLNVHREMKTRALSFIYRKDVLEIPFILTIVLYIYVFVWLSVSRHF